MPVQPSEHIYQIEGAIIALKLVPLIIMKRTHWIPITVTGKPNQCFLQSWCILSS